MMRTTRPRRPTRLLPGLDRLEGRELMAFAGSLDPNFGTAGIYSAPIDPNATTGLSTVAAVALQPDGSILEAGVVGSTAATGFSTLAVVRLTAAGSLDTSFGHGGEADVTLPSGQPASRNSISQGTIPLLLQPDGKIVVAGQFISTTKPATGYPMVVERFNANGTPDTTFGSGGRVVLGPSGVNDGGASFSFGALQANGQIVLAGSVLNPQAQNNSVAVAVTRLNADGSLDTAFGTNGLVILYDAGPQSLSVLSYAVNEIATGLAVQHNGQVVVVGSYTAYSGGDSSVTSTDLFRLNADGSRDLTLSQVALQASILTIPTDDSVALLPGGQILIAGYNQGRVDVAGAYAGSAMVELNGDGSLAHVSALSPPLAAPKGILSTIPAGIGVEANGDIVVGMKFYSPITAQPPGTYLTTLRLKPDLSPDDTYGSGGLASIPLPIPSLTKGSFQTTGTFAVTPDGRIIVGGVAEATLGGTPLYSVVARLTATGSAHAGDFTGDGIADPAVYLPSQGVFAIADSSGRTSGQVVPFGGPGPGTTIPAPGDYTGSGRDEVAAYLPGLGIYAYRPSTGGPDVYVHIGSPGPGLTIPAPGDYYGTGQDDVAVYLADIGAFAVVDPTGKTAGEIVPFGGPGVGAAIPVPGDYDGSGKTEFAIYIPSLGEFAYRPANGGPDVYVPFGGPGAGNVLPMPGDYDGSGKTEFAAYLPGLGKFAYRPANGGPDVVIPFGGPGRGTVLPAAGDYTGSGHTELGVYLPAYGELAYRPASGTDVYIPFGIPGPGQTIPVTTVVLSPFPGSGSGSGPRVSAFAFSGEVPGLDAMVSPTVVKKRAGGGQA